MKKSRATARGGKSSPGESPILSSAVAGDPVAAAAGSKPADEPAPVLVPAVIEPALLREVPASPEVAALAAAINQRLVDQYTEIAKLAGGLAHEIKNPLSTIRLNMELLAEEFAESEAQRDRRALKKIETVQRECQRLEDLLNDFLQFAKVRRLRLAPTDLNREIEQVLEFSRPRAAEQKIELVRYLDPNLPPVLADPESLHGVLLNLVLNAEQAMPHGGQLVARTRSGDGYVELDLIDTGCGMDEKTLSQIFDAFYSTKRGGSGLGLPTARKIVEAHGGTIAVESEVGRGTKFTIRLPQWQENSPD